MYYSKEIMDFNESKKGQTINYLNHINSSLGFLTSLLDNFMDIKIKIVEIIKDIDIITTDINNDTNLFDIRRKKLFDNWIKKFDISSFLPIGAKQACFALNISNEILCNLNLIENFDYKEYLYNVSLYLKQIFIEINELKGVNVKK